MWLRASNETKCPLGATSYLVILGTKSQMGEMKNHSSEKSHKDQQD